MAGGRPSTYTPEMLRLAHDYADTRSNTILTVVGLCARISRSKSTVYKWVTEPDKTEFSDIVKDIEEKQEQMLIEKGLSGDFNPAITKLLLSKHGYSDKQIIDHQSADGSMSPTEDARDIARSKIAEDFSE